MIGLLPLALWGLPQLATSTQEPAAIAIEVSGAVRVRTANRIVHSFDWLDPGTRLIVEEGASLMVVLVSGKRYQLESPGEYTILRQEVRAMKGKANPLPSLPPMPTLTAKPRPSSRAAATRIRGRPSAIPMAPNGSGVVLPDQVVLRFTPPSRKPTQFRYEVEDEKGNLVFEQTGGGLEMPVPPEILRPGRRYTWLVSEISGSTSVILGWDAIVTLSAEQWKGRKEFLAALERIEATPAMRLEVRLQLDRKLGILHHELASK